MRIQIFWLIFSLTLSNQMCFAVNGADMIRVNSRESNRVKEKSWFNVFIPGLVQYRNEEWLIAWGIILGEAVSVGAGCIYGYLSDLEYHRYKGLPKGTRQEEFERHINNSNSYGTTSIVCFTVAGVIYLGSLIDAIYFSRSKEEYKYGFYVLPVGLCVAVKF